MTGSLNAGWAAIRYIFTNSRRHASSRATSGKVFADAKSAEFLASAAAHESIPDLHGLPEVIVTGRANVGKSTLLNAVLGRRNLLHTSKTAGRTQTLNFYQVGPQPGHLVLVDAPGYGSRGRREWGDLFDYYVQNRKELRRVFILFNAKHGLNEVDRMMLRSLDEQCQASGGVNWTLQAIITKTDALRTGELLKVVKDIQRDIFETAPTCLPPILTAAHKQPHFGIDDVRESIQEACGLGRTEAKVYRPP